MTVRKRILVRGCFVLILLLSSCISRGTPTQPLQPTETETQPVVTPRSIDTEDSSIRIELNSPNGFEVRNAAMVLRVGDTEFISGGLLEGDTHTLVFALTQQEYASLQDGDVISFLYGPFENEARRFFGRLQKEQLQDAALRFTPHFDMTKQDAVDRLRDLRSLMGSDDLRESLDAAQMALEHSLDSDLWDSPSRLDPANGESVFILELEALEQLERLENTDTFPLGSVATLRAIVKQIVLVDRGLAALAIEEASKNGMNPSDIEKAMNQLNIGDAERLSSDYLYAIEHYRDAWRIAVPDS